MNTRSVGTTSSIRNDMEEAIRIMENMKNYDASGFAIQLKFWVKELDFFNNTLVEKHPEKDASLTTYHISESKRPTEGQVAYFNLRRGYPKELYDGHQCYILKDFGLKLLIIPTTSVKGDSAPLDEEFEMDIKIKNFENDLPTRLQFSDIRSIDAQRINEKRAIYDVETDRTLILGKVKKVLTL
ncbi:hypothetical protein [Brevibacillus sp. NRS-1366]|uniref:hypothetical protein n=1 Tax=Brevibacillus sp. NRS-1366 TaxID=3233899 RepID=UPI003D205B06